MTEPEDLGSDFVAELDQLKAATGDLSGIWASHFHALVQAGLERDEALALTLGFQGAYMASLLGSEG